MTNPFDAPPPEGGQQKFYFGRLRLVTNKINLVKGASYVEPGLNNQNGKPWEFRGKMKADSGQHTHVIPIIQAKNSSGQDYNAFRDFMYWGSDPVYQVTFPSLKEHFGDKLDGIWGKSAFVQAEVVDVDDNGYSKQAFRIVEVFANRQAMEAAETTHFAQFSQTPEEIADDIPGFDEPGDDAPVGMTKEQAVNLLPTLSAACGGDYEKLKAQLEGMPVVVKALGGIDAPEVKAYDK
jgi:hypothetical protein